MNRLFYLLLLLCLSPMALFAAGEVNFKETDFIPRVVNFLIFVAILYYLVYDKLVAYFKSRKTDIEKQLQTAQDKLLKSKKQKTDIKNKILENEKLAN